MTAQDETEALADALVLVMGNARQREVAGVAALPVVVAAADVLWDQKAWVADVERHIAPALTTIILGAGVAAALSPSVAEGFTVSAPPVAHLLADHLAGFVAWGRYLEEHVMGVVREGMADGLEGSRVADRLRGDYRLSDKRARALAEVEAGAARNGAAVTAYRMGGTRLAKEWRSVRDLRVRSSHVEADGQRADVAGQFVVGGVRCEYPGDPSLPPRERMNCRCWIAPAEVQEEAAVTAPPQSVVAAVGDPNNPGGMIALYPDDPASLVADDPAADTADELHVTIAFVAEDAAELDTGQLDAIDAAATAGAAVRSDPLVLRVVGHGTLGSQEPPATVLFVQADDATAGAAAVERAARAELDDYGAEAFPPVHDSFVPHLTLGYGVPLELAESYVGREITFSSGVTVQLAGERTDFPWGGGEPIPEGQDDAAVPSADQEANMATTDNATMAAGDEPAVEPTADTAPAVDTAPRWTGPLVALGVITGDGRGIERGALSTRDLPLPLMLSAETSMGHMGAKFAGGIDALDFTTSPDLVYGSGAYDTGGEAGREAHRLNAGGVLRGVSVDIDSAVVELRDRDGNPLPDDDDAWLEAMLSGNIVEWLVEGRIMGATITPFPAFAEAFIEVVQDDALVAAAGARGPIWRVHAPIEPAPITASAGDDTAMTWTIPAAGRGLVASAAVLDADLLLEPPARWFAIDPELPAEAPFSVLPDGRCYGLVARWDTPHIGYQGQRVYPPRDPDGGRYSHFRGGKGVVSAEGQFVSTGCLYMDTVHPDLARSASDAQAFYAHTGSAVADVAVYETEVGILVAGRVRPQATAEQVSALRASDVSPDWRPINGHLSMVGLLAVNVSGFPGQALVASLGEGGNAGRYVQPGRYAARIDASTGEVLALVAAGMVRHRPDYGALSARLAVVEGYIEQQRQATAQHRALAALERLQARSAD